MGVPGKNRGRGNTGEPTLLDGPYDPTPGAYGDDDPGGGPYDPETGLRDWYDESETGNNEGAVSWETILTHLPQTFVDLHFFYGIDVESGILHERSWGWLETRIVSLINKNGQLRDSLGLPPIPTI